MYARLPGGPLVHPGLLPEQQVFGETAISQKMLDAQKWRGFPDKESIAYLRHKKSYDDADRYATIDQWTCPAQ